MTEATIADRWFGSPSLIFTPYIYAVMYLTMGHLIAAKYRFGLLLLLFVAPSLFGKSKLVSQPVLIDSIQRALLLVEDEHERMDLLLGMCRAIIFTDGTEQTKPYVRRAVEHAVSTNDSAGLGRALLFQYMSDLTVEEGIPQEVWKSWELSQSTEDRNLQIFAIYHIAEHFLYDKNDLVHTREWLDRGHQRLAPGMNPKHQGNLYKVTALYHEALGERDSMDYWLALALREFERVGSFRDPRLNHPPSGNWDQGSMNQAQVLNYQGNNAVARGDYATAQAKFSAALAIARDWRADNSLARTLNNIGNMQTVIGDIEGAIASLSSALQIHQAQANRLYASHAAQRIAYLFLLAEDPAAAGRFYADANESAIAILDSIEMINCELGMAWSAQRGGDLITAEKHLSRGERLAELSRDTISMSYLLSERARQTYIAKRYREAVEQFRQAIALHQRFNHEDNIQTDYLGLARCYLELDQGEEALEIMEKAEAIVLRNGRIHKQRETAELYAKIAEAMGDLPLAIRQHKMIQAINDSLNQQDAQLSLRREEIRQNIGEYRAENEALERERQLLSQRNKLYLALTTALLLLLLIGGYLLLRLRAVRRALAAGNEELKALNATKDRFFGIIAHDIRSPIVALDGVGDQLRFYLDKGKTERATSLADNVGLTAKRLSRLLDQLLAWALLQQGTMPHRPQSLPLAEAVEEVVALFEQSVTAKGISLDYQVPEALVIRADPTGLRTMLRNLVSNAIKFTPRGGRVLIKGEKLPQGEIEMEVSDDGIGIGDEQLQNIRAGNAASKRGTQGERGSGLGLRLVRDLADLHGARLTVESASGAGSRFRLTFPA